MSTRTTRTTRTSQRIDDESAMDLPSPSFPNPFAANTTGEGTQGTNQGSPSTDSESYGLPGGGSTFETPNSGVTEDSGTQDQDSTSGAGMGTANLDSEEDEALSGSESSMGSAYAPPNLADLIRLDERACRSPMKGKQANGETAACVCGRLTSECKRHAVFRLSGKGARFEPGYYQKAKGVKGHHGIQGTYYSIQQVEAIRREEDRNLFRAAATMADEDSEEEREEIPNPRRVSFGAPDHPRGTRPGAPSSNNSNGSQASSSGVIVLDETLEQPTTVGTPPKLWYGVIDAVGARWVMADLTVVRQYEATKAFTLGRIFTKKEEADRWQREVGTNQSLTAKAPKGSRRERVPTQSGQDPKGTGSSEKYGTGPHKSGRSRRRRKSKNQRHRGHKRHSSSSPSEDPSDSSEESTTSKSSTSSSEPGSVASYSSSSSSSHAHKQSKRYRSKQNSRRQRRRGRRNRRKYRGPEKLETQQLYGEDESVGDKSHIHGLSIQGLEIEKAVGPPDMRTKDGAEVFKVATDVTSLPGMLCTTGDWGNQWTEETQATTEMAATLLSTAIGKRAQIHDSLWKTPKRHPLGQVKNSAALFKLVKSVGKAEKPAREQQEYGIQIFMRARRYSEDAIKAYLQTGFLTRLINQSFQYYYDLLGAVRQLAYDHSELWEGGPAKAMLDFHSERLFDIRMSAMNRKFLILRTYTYLRDAAAKSFYHESMTESLWSRMAALQLQAPPSNTDSNGGGTGESAKNKAKCSHCKCQELHKLFKVDLGRNACPLKNKAAKDARVWGKKAVTMFKEDQGMEGGIKAALERVSADE